MIFDAEDEETSPWPNLVLKLVLVCYNKGMPCGREMRIMAGFVPKDKLSKKARKELNRQRRVTWDFSPVARTVESRKLYSRKRIARIRDENGPDSFFPGINWGGPFHSLDSSLR